MSIKELRSKLQSYFFDIENLNRENWWSDRAGKSNLIATLLYYLVCIVIACRYIHDPAQVKSASYCWRYVYFSAGLILVLLPHIWIWLESIAFFDWSAKKYSGEELKEERERFKQHLDFSKSIWLIFMGFVVSIFLKLNG